MREILFRGKRIDNGAWVEGSLIVTTAVKEKTYIVDSCWCEHGKVNEGGFADFNWLNAFEVIPHTVGQFTGLTDKNGKKIFEGDVVKKSWTYYVIHQRRSQIDAFIGQIVFDSGSYIMKEQGEFIGSSHNGERLEIIGNIHDNPELLKGEEENE